MRPEFEALVKLGPFPPDDELDEGTNTSTPRRSTTCFAEIPTTEEALALLSVFPPDDSTAFGLAWSVLHAVEASPQWPVWGALDDRNWWVTFLRERCERADLSAGDQSNGP